MKAFVSWSTGKDCSYALHKFIETYGRECAVSLLHMKRAVSAHRVSEELIYAQAEAMGMELVVENVNTDLGYSYHFRKALASYKDRGVEYGVFGDIYLETHREWIVRECEACGIKPIFPLWDMDVKKIYLDFLECGFTATIIAIRNNVCPKEFLGETLTKELYEQMSLIEGFDVCGENGEFHTFVSNGPTFIKALDFKIVNEYADDKNTSLIIDLNK